MAIGEKYAPLGNWLKGHAGDSVKLTFDELNQIIPIPNHAYMNRPSWANLSSPASFCSSWISAGYVVDSISLEEQWVVFRKGEVQSHTHHHKPPYSQYERALEELDSIGVKRINVMVDSDYQVKEEVRKARDRYIEMGAAAGFEMAPITWTQKQKGVDDLYKHLFRDK